MSLLKKLSLSFFLFLFLGSGRAIYASSVSLDLAKCPSEDAQDTLSLQLFEAVSANDQSTAERLIRKGANVNIANEEGNSLLYITAQKYHSIAMVNLLIESGASLIARTPVMQYASIHIAVITNKFLIVQALVKNRTGKKRLSALTVSLVSGYVREQVRIHYLIPELARLLACFCPSLLIEIRDANGNTPLHLAAGLSNEDIEGRCCTNIPAPSSTSWLPTFYNATDTGIPIADILFSA